MKLALGLVGGLLAGAAIGWGVAVQYGGARGGSAGSSGPLFELDGVKYSDADLSGESKAAFHDARMEAHEKLKGEATQLALRLMLAKERNPNAKLTDALPPFEELLVAAEATEDEMQKVFEDNKARLPPGTTYDQVKMELQRYVQTTKRQEALRAKHQDMIAKNRFKFLPAAPEAPVVQLDLNGYPTKGAGSGTVVEVSDYLCPHCQALSADVDAMIPTLGARAKFVQVNYPLNPTGLSGLLARGAYCAQQHGDDAFWKFHAAAFTTAKAQGWKTSDPVAPEAIGAVVTAAGLDPVKISACIETPAAVDFVKQTVEKMQKAGVSGTPAFFVNGRKIHVHHDVKAAVDEALK